MQTRILSLTLLLMAAAAAQETVAPTPEQVGAPNGQNIGGYNVVDSWEFGYRFDDIHGNAAKYRSDVNYLSGVRLLGSSLRIYSREGHGGLFDEITLRTQGLGGDPYQLSTLRVEKNRLYRYDLTWRLQDYYNPGLVTVGGFHLLDTERTMQDHDFTLLPESSFKLFAGYSRNLQTGPAISSVHLFDPQGTEFPLFENIWRLENEYRLGGEANLLGFRLTVLHGWVNYSESAPDSGTFLPIASGQPPVTLSGFSRTQPYRGSSPYWRVNLLKQAKVWSVGARFAYAGSRRSFFFNETAAGANPFSSRNTQILITGDGARPMSTGNLTLSVFPGSKFTFTNQTSFYNTRMDGNNSYLQLDNATLSSTLLNFQFLGIRTIVNSSDLTYRATKQVGVYAGYSFSTRRIQSVEGFTLGSNSDALRAEQTNDLHSGTIGLRLRPLPPLSINLDAEIGRASRPIFPISERNYEVYGGRVQYRRKSLQLSAAVRTNYNTNSTSFTEFSSRSRNYSADASWTPWSWFGLDASYSKLHLNTLGGIAYFALGQSVAGDHSIYISNIHAGHLMAHVGIKGRTDLGFGYSRVQDTGDGRSSPLASSEGGSPLPVFLAAQTFPVSFESPFARISVKLHERIRWNLGWQFYRYREDFDRSQRYNTHTGYTSVLWSF